MRMQKVIPLVLVALVVSAAADAQVRRAAPQPRKPRLPFSIGVSGGYQVGSHDFTDSATFVANAEEAQYRTSYRVKGGPALQISGGAPLWRQLGVGVAFSRFSHATPTTLNGTVPHPFFFNQPRTIDGTISDLARSETAVHLQLRGVFTASRRIQVTVGGGPSYFRVKQQVVTHVSYTDAYPYDTAQFRAVTSTSGSATRVGFNAGADVAYFVTNRIGFGFGVLASGASLDMPAAEGGTQSIDAGGVQAGAGIRLRF